MVTAPQPIAYLTCELKGRDFASRLLIASHIIKADFPVVVGQQWAIVGNIPTAPKGCVLFKSTNLVQSQLMAKSRAAGHVVVAADEEVLASAREDFARSTHPNVVDHCDVFLALSEPHREELIKAYPGLEPKITIAGNARVDILRDSRPARPKEAPYILFNTSFGIVNSIWGGRDEAISIWVGAGGHAPGLETKALVAERIVFEQAAMKETQGLLAWVLANTSLDVVVRPHPQERPELWSGISPHRVTVVAGSDAVPWMRHAVATIHSESTTGVEAAIMGAKVINLSPPGAWSNRLIVSDVNPTVATAVQAAEMIGTLLSKGEWPAPKADPFHMYPSGGAHKTAEAIMQTLPPPRFIPGIVWHRGKRSDIHRQKFTATLDEVHAQLDCVAVELDDSLFYLERKR
jgi:surface carbohydrate biosynthesis protein